MKLEFKNIAAYLPYDLKWTSPFGGLDVMTGLIKDNVVINSDGTEIDDSIDLNYTKENRVKPVLRPFTDLTKEITVKGETFIPIYKLFELEYKGTTHFENIRKMYFNEVGRFIEASHIGTGATTSVNVLNPNKNNYWKIQKLHEWHFDTDALINHNLAIDINTL